MKRDSETAIPAREASRIVDRGGSERGNLDRAAAGLTGVVPDCTGHRLRSARGRSRRQPVRGWPWSPDSPGWRAGFPGRGPPSPSSRAGAQRVWLTLVSPIRERRLPFGGLPRHSGGDRTWRRLASRPAAASSAFTSRNMRKLSRTMCTFAPFIAIPAHRHFQHSPTAPRVGRRSSTTSNPNPSICQPR